MPAYVDADVVNKDQHADDDASPAAPVLADDDAGAAVAADDGAAADDGNAAALAAANIGALDASSNAHLLARLIDGDALTAWTSDVSVTSAPEPGTRALGTCEGAARPTHMIPLWLSTVQNLVITVLYKMKILNKTHT